jgi:uncharacterized OsmC-like protein
MTGDIDLQGLLGLSDEVRNGYEHMRMEVTIEGDGSEEELRTIVEGSRARSAVYDALTNGMSVEVVVAS